MSVISTNESTEFIIGHVIYNLYLQIPTENHLFQQRWIWLPDLFSWHRRMPSFDEFFWPEDYLVDPQQYLFCATFHCYFFVCRVGNTDQIMTLFVKSEANRRVFTQVPFGVKSEIYVQSAPNNSNDTHTFMCLDKVGRFGQHLNWFKIQI